MPHIGSRHPEVVARGDAQTGKHFPAGHLHGRRPSEGLVGPSAIEDEAEPTVFLAHKERCHPAARPAARTKKVAHHKGGEELEALPPVGPEPHVHVRRDGVVLLALEVDVRLHQKPLGEVFQQGSHLSLKHREERDRSAANVG